ncbi:MAG: site-specific integrase [Bacteroidia bacterium]|jgi:site-specific recombinase XerD|nr:MAG: site-specific integrase [Bacteroidia bacterium]
MVTKQKVRIVYRLNTQKQKEGKHPVFMRIFVDNKKSEVFTEQYVSVVHWDNKAKKVRSACKDADYMNSYLDNLKAKVQNQFYELRSQGKEITSELLKNQLLGIDQQPKQKTILEAFDYHNLKLSEQAKIGKVVAKTYTRYIITKNKVLAFMQHQYKKENMPLPEMRLRFVTEFEHYLLTVDKLQSNTAHKYIKNLKKIMNMAVGLDWIPSNPFNQFKCSYSSPEREILNQDEINILLTKKLHAPRLEEVRDVFIFCCYTGFAYSDVYQFPHNAVMKGLDGNLWLSTLRQKTGTKESVPLLPVALEIIEKYRNHEYCTKYDKLLPVNSNQRYNAYLKEIADICGINKNLTSHIARHTFATTITLANGVPIETVSAMLGHNSIRTTQIYAKVVEQKVSDDMQKLKERLFAQPLTKIG